MTTQAPPRVFTITAKGDRPLTVNALVNMHRHRWAAHTRDTRQLWWALAKQARIPRMDAVTINATPLHKNGRSPQDVAACAPEVKAAIDGLVDAGVIPDDTAAHLRAVTFMPPAIRGVDGLELLIMEVT